jgi:hypothetical protein
MSDKVKTYKNPKRSEQEPHKAYTPQYQLMGIEPEEYKSAISPASQATVKNAQSSSSDNPRLRKPGIRQTYADTTTSPVGRGRGPVPNVGNNMEHTWSSVDGEIVDDEIVDDLTLDNNHPMVDNNEFVSDKALGITQGSQTNTGATRPVPVTEVTPEGDEVLPILYNLAEGDYLLLVNGVAVCSGPVEEIQEQARLLVFGEHEMCDGNPIPVDGLAIVKRVSIKIGLFLE